VDNQLGYHRVIVDRDLVTCAREEKAKKMVGTRSDSYRSIPSPTKRVWNEAAHVPRPSF
jgi:hypothetical protein